MNLILLKRIKRVISFTATTRYLSCILVKGLSLSLSLFLLLNLCSCLSIVRPYKCTVAFEFADMSDESVIEARLKAFMFDIKNKETEGNKVIYTIDHKMYAPNGLYDLFCSRDVVSIEDKDGNVMLTRKDVLSIEFESSKIRAQVSDAVFADISDGKPYFVLGDKKVWVDFVEISAEDKTVKSYPPMGIIGETIDEDETVYIKGALTLISEPPKGKVTATVIEEINGR